MSASDSYDVCRRCYRRLTEADDYDPVNGALCEDCKKMEEPPDDDEEKKPPYPG